jgi:surfeit locus 1 family protein
LTLLFILLFLLLVSLGYWQLSRAEEKRKLLQDFLMRVEAPPKTAAEIKEAKQFHRVILTGQFDNNHTFLLDNKIFNHQVGDEVYTPFYVPILKQTILVDRGFIPLGQNRNVLPVIPDILGQVTITGLLDLPPRYAALGSIADSSHLIWPLRIEFVNLRLLKSYLPNTFSLSPYILRLPKNHSAGFAIEWQIMSMPPEKHVAYAVQWFALALTLLILFVVFTVRRPNN